MSFACLPAIYIGWQVFQFSKAEIALGPDDPVSGAFTRWAAVPGLQFQARESSLTSVDDWNNDAQTTKRRDEQVEMLAVRPLAADYWLKLADMRLITRSGDAAVAGALSISALIASNEHDLMVQRGIFGVANWEILPADLQSRTASDLAAGPLADHPIPDMVSTRLRKELIRKTFKVRSQIREALKEHNVSAVGLTAVGL